MLSRVRGTVQALPKGTSHRYDRKRSLTHERPQRGKKVAEKGGKTQRGATTSALPSPIEIVRD